MTESKVTLVERLRNFIVTGHNPDGPPAIKYHPAICDEAANALEQHLSAARAFLEPYKDANDHSLEYIAGVSATATVEVCLMRDGSFAGTLPMSPHQAAAVLAFRKIIEQAGETK